MMRPESSKPMNSESIPTQATAIGAEDSFTLSSKTSTQRNDRYYRADIDGLRALAVVAVIINHVNPSRLNSGHLGVDIFFVISGFVITLSLLRYHAANPGVGLRQFLADFYRRRIKRLMPALMGCVLITSLIVLCVSISPQESLSTGKLALVGLSNIYLYNNGTNYNAESAGANAFLQTWSLGVEEQFYLVFPLILWLLIRLQGHRVSKILVVISILSFLSFGNYIHLLKTDYWAAFFLMPSRFWELGAGVLTCLVLSQDQFTIRWPRFIAAAQIVLIVALLACLSAPLAIAGRTTPVVVATTSALIFCGQKNYFQLNPLLFRPFIFLGKISYSLYLWHWTILYVARSLGLQQGWLHETTIVAASLVVGYASYRYIENPLRHARWGESNALILGKGMAYPAALIAVITMSQRLLLSIYPPQQKELFNQQNWLGSTQKPCHVPSVTKQSIGTKIKQCIDFQPNRRHAVVIGNSHSEQYAPAIQAALPGWDVDTLTMWGCSYEPAANADAHFRQKGCDIYAKEIKTHLEHNIQNNDIVFLGFIVNDGLLSPEFKSQITALARSLAKRNAHLVLLDDLYLAQTDVNQCEGKLLPYRLGILKKAGDDACSIKKRYSRNFQSLSRYDQMIAKITQENANVHRFSIRNQLCPTEQCPRKLDDGTPIYQDQSHLFSGAARQLGPELRRQLLQSGLQL